MKTNSSLPHAATRHIRHNLTGDEKREIAFKICDRIASGEYLTAICGEDGMPHPNTLRNWALGDPVIASAYASAQHFRIETLMSSIIRIVDAPVPTCTDARGNTRIDPAAVKAMSIQVNALKWMATVLMAQPNSLSPVHKIPVTDARPAPSVPHTPVSPVHKISGDNAQLEPISLQLSALDGLSDDQLGALLSRYLEDENLFLDLENPPGGKPSSMCTKSPFLAA